MAHHTLRILFVCYGNICRSPTAECVIRDLITHRLPEVSIEFDSAGTSGHHHGKGADQRTIAAARIRGYAIDSIARAYTVDDVERFDLILAMDRENLAHLQRTFGQQEKIRLFSHLLDDTWPSDVPDPYYGGTQGFEYVLDMIEAAAGPLEAWIKSQLVAARADRDQERDLPKQIAD